MLVALTTTPNVAEAEMLATRIVEKGLAGCVQILPQMSSVYMWEGKVTTGAEHLLLIKTTAEKYGALEEFIKQNHSYDVPEIAAVETSNVSAEYRNWLEGCLR